MAKPVCHIISNDDVSLTTCGHLLAAPADPGDTAAVRLLARPGDQAIWDDVEPDAATVGCPECWDTYVEGVDVRYDRPHSDGL